MSAIEIDAQRNLDELKQQLEYERRASAHAVENATLWKIKHDKLLERCKKAAFQERVWMEEASQNDRWRPRIPESHRLPVVS